MTEKLNYTRRPQHERPENGAEGRSPAELIADHRNRDLNPAITPNKVMIVGTGGVGLWERHWSRLVLAGAKNPWAKTYELYQNGWQSDDLMRAMCFAMDEAAQLRLDLIHTSLVIFRRTPAGILQTERYNNLLDQSMDRFRITHPYPGPLEQFIQEHGNGWEEFADKLLDVAQNTLDFGIHLTAMGIHRADESWIELGRIIMAEANRWMVEQLRQPGPDQAGELPKYDDLIPAEIRGQVRAEIDQFTARIRESDRESAAEILEDSATDPDRDPD